MRGRDVDWGNQSIAVVSKGSRAYQWMPTSPDSLNWLRLYLNEMPLTSAEDALWLTLRPSCCPGSSCTTCDLEAGMEARGSATSPCSSD